VPPNAARRLEGRASAITLVPALALLLSTLQATGAGDGGAAAALRVWVRDASGVHQVGEGASLGSDDAASALLPLGSLVKPFLAKAWASAHPDEPTPRFRCTGGSQCWRPAGHGDLGLTTAVAVSCNAYFRALAAATPRDLVAQVLRDEGFDVRAPLSPDAALDLTPGEPQVRATPASLLDAYVRLARSPWPAGERVRQEVLAGLADSARTGTASGLAARGLRAKTGTVPALDGAPLATSGFTVAFDDGGWAVMALLARGTGREAAQRLAALLPRLRPGAVTHEAPVPSETPVGATQAAHPFGLAREGPRALQPGNDARHSGWSAIGPSVASEPTDARSAPRVAWVWNPASGAEPPPVRVALFGTLAPHEIDARNLGSGPVDGSAGFVGAGSVRSLVPGLTLESSLWELTIPKYRLRRVVAGSLAVARGPSGSLRALAEMPAAEYVDGVIAAELPGASPAPDRIASLGAAVLRFLGRGSRHADADVCDSTHCAWFVGRGPRVLWPDPRHPVEVRGAGPSRGLLDALPPALWEQIKSQARDDGPSSWTADCGGAPLSAHALWGNGDRRVWVCPRHGTTLRSRWSREWSRADLARAFGGDVERLELVEPDGVWTLRVTLARGDVRELRYDDVHRQLASVLGWDALPSPALAIAPTADGFRADGAGSGHRVGLCLAD